MITDRKFFESQAQAAAMLGIELHVLRNAKAEGCPAFRSGRIYRAPLETWLKARKLPQTKLVRAGKLDEDNFPDLESCRWRDRREVLFETMCFVAEAHRRGDIDAVQFSSIGRATLDHLCALARAWGISTDEFDPAGFVRTWAEEFDQLCGETVKTPAQPSGVKRARTTFDKNAPKTNRMTKYP